MGTEAVLALMEATPTSQPVVIALSGNQTVRIPLMHCVEKTLAVAQAMGAKNFKEAQELRGRSFKGNLEIYIRLSKLRPHLFSSKNVRKIELNPRSLIRNSFFFFSSIHSIWLLSTLVHPLVVLMLLFVRLFGMVYAKDIICLQYSMDSKV